MSDIRKVLEDSFDKWRYMYTQFVESINFLSLYRFYDSYINFVKKICVNNKLFKHFYPYLNCNYSRLTYFKYSISYDIN